MEDNENMKEINRLLGFKEASGDLMDDEPVEINAILDNNKLFVSADTAIQNIGGRTEEEYLQAILPPKIDMEKKIRFMLGF